MNSGESFRCSWPKSWGLWRSHWSFEGMRKYGPTVVRVQHAFEYRKKFVRHDCV